MKPGDKIICYGGTHYGAVHQVVEMTGRYVKALHVASGDSVQIHISDCETFPVGLQMPGCLPQGGTLDCLLTVEQFAIWRQISVETARAQIKAGDVPVIQHSRQDIRIHPGTYIETAK